MKEDEEDKVLGENIYYIYIYTLIKFAVYVYLCYNW